MDLQTLLDQGGRVTFPSGVHIVEKPLEIGDNTHLICAPDTVIRLADGANCPLLVNRDKGREVFSTGITVEGGVWDGNNTAQDRKAYTHPVAGWGQLICFTYVTDLVLRDLTVKDPNSFGIQLTDTDRFTVTGIRFDYNNKCLNMDGVHVNGWARNGLISNLKGNTNDDMVALNSDEGAGFSSGNDIENITVDGIYGGDDGWTAVRLLSRNARVRNITIRNVYGAYKFNAVSFTHWANPYVPGYGHFDNIIIENLFAASARKTGIGHGGLIWFQPAVHDVGTVVIHNYLRSEPEDHRNDVYLVDVGEDVHIRNLITENLIQDIPDGKAPIHIDPTAKIGNLIQK